MLCGLVSTQQPFLHTLTVWGAGHMKLPCCLVSRQQPFLHTLTVWGAGHLKLLCCAVQLGHAWLSQHYKWALDRVFLQQGHSHVIIVEDDMLFSPDFLHFFEATAVLLDRDPSLWCVSTWNDNGLKSYDWDPMRMVWALLLCTPACACGVAWPLLLM